MTTRRSIDMSKAAVERRIEDMRQLYRLMLTFRDVKLLGPVTDPKR